MDTRHRLVHLLVLLVLMSGTCLSQQTQRQDTLIKFAHLLYNYQRFDVAVEKYTEFLQLAPRDEKAAMARFYLGDSLRQLRLSKEAEDCFRAYLDMNLARDFIGPAAFAVALYCFNDGRSDECLHYWRMATDTLDKPFSEKVSPQVPDKDATYRLPRAPTQVMININTEGEVRIDNKVCSIIQVLDKIAALTKFMPDLSVVLQMDQPVDFQHAMPLLTQLREAGIWNITLSPKRKLLSSP